MTMKESNAVTDDPVCGIPVDEAAALRTERDGTTFCTRSRERWGARRRIT